jgi:beta-N-acetylhexosaminidase
LPVVDASRKELKHDFAPFAALRDLPMAMSAHLLYTTIDPRRPATASPIVVAEIMRGEIGFDGLILSDDLSMKALSGSFEERAAAVIEAGLDIVLHCNGTMEEARAVASATPALSGASLRRAKVAEAAIKPPQPFDVERGEQELAAIKAELGVA